LETTAARDPGASPQPRVKTARGRRRRRRRRPRAGTLGRMVGAGARRALVAALAAGAAAAGGLALAPKHQQATVLLVVTPLRSQDPNFAGLPVLRSGSDPTPSLSTAQGVVAGVPVAQMTAARMGRGWNETQVAKDINVSVDSS